jgi:hypothetical protein
MQENSALLDINILCVTGFRLASAVLLGNNFDLNAVDASDKLRLEQRLTLLLATFVARAWASAVDACGDRETVRLEGLDAIDHDEDTVHPVRERDGNVGYDLEIRALGREHHGGTVRGLLLVRDDTCGPRLLWVHRWMGL